MIYKQGRVDAGRALYLPETGALNHRLRTGASQQQCERSRNLHYARVMKRLECLLKMLWVSSLQKDKRDREKRIKDLLDYYWNDTKAETSNKHRITQRRRFL